MKSKQTSKKTKLTPRLLSTLALRFIAKFSLASTLIATAAHWAVLLTASGGLSMLNAAATEVKYEDELNSTIQSSVDASSKIALTWAFITLIATAVMLFVANDRKAAARSLFDNLATLAACVVSVVFSQVFLRSVLSAFEF